MKWKATRKLCFNQLPGFLTRAGCGRVAKDRKLGDLPVLTKPVAVTTSRFNALGVDIASPGALEQWKEDSYRQPPNHYEANLRLYRNDEWRYKGIVEDKVLHAFPRD